MQNDNVIVLDKLSKRYNAKAPFALQDVSLTIHKGEIFGFLGPNGAGKSTAIRTLLNFIQPTSGSAHILGMDIVKNSVAIKQRLGYLSGDFAVYEKMTGKQFFAYMNELQPPKRVAYVKELAFTFKAEVNKRISTLSKGNRQKIGIIQAFMHEPDVLILDEPTDGLDPLMQDAFYDLLAETKKRGATIFMSSHNLAEVRKVCDRVAIIKEGRLVSESSIAELAEAAAQTLVVQFAGKAPTKELRKVKGVSVEPHKDGSVSIHVRGKLAPVLLALGKYDVIHIATREFNLEDEFMQYYKTGKTGVKK